MENKTYTALWKKLVKVTTMYLEESTEKEISDSIENIDEDGTSYTTSKKNIDNYKYVRTVGYESGTRNEDDIVVKYYYKKKESTLNIKYLDCKTNKEIAVNNNYILYYEDEYDTDIYEVSANIPENYIRVSTNKSNNYKGVVSSNKIEVNYCYNKKENSINSDITMNGSTKIESSKDRVSYKINYNAYFTDYIGSAN